MLRGFLVNVACAALATASSSLVKHCVQGRIQFEGSAFSKLNQIVSLFQSPVMWLALCAMVGNNILWLYILSQQPMSVAFPIQVSLVFLLTTVVSVTVFSEQLTAYGLLGIAFIVTGVILVSQR
jgi:multidrug transporter EmrE-like cation transporter